VSQQQRPDNVPIDEIPVDIDNTQSAEVDPADLPDEIESITRGVAGEQPPTNPIVDLKAARWWYIHGKDGTNPAFQWAIEWGDINKVRSRCTFSAASRTALFNDELFVCATIDGVEIGLVELEGFRDDIRKPRAGG
jgi:hypothetical protein